MSAHALILWSVVFCIGVPSAWRNPTAAALVLAKIAGWAWHRITGDSLPVSFYVAPDIFVVSVIYAKSRYRPCDRYLNTWHQLKCLVLERSPADRAVLGIFAISWALYVAPLHPYHVWWMLWAGVILQFLFASAESLEAFWRSRSMAGGEAERGSGPHSRGDRFIKIFEQPKVPVLSCHLNVRPPFFGVPVPAHSSHSGLAVKMPFRVPHILDVAYVAQVGDAIVRWIAVNVVNLSGRPASAMDGPSNAVGIRGIVQNSCLSAVTDSERERLLASPPSVPDFPVAVASKEAARSAQPKQLPRFRLIAEKLTKRFRGRYFSGSHCEESFRDGQGRAVLQAPFRPAFSSTNPLISQHRAAERASLMTANGGGGDG